MTGKTPMATNMVPEDHLTASLSPLWRQRFWQAIELITDSVDQSLPLPPWDDIANQCAISPYHFRRMFRVIFGETPGQYVRRLRLQRAAHLLFDEPSTSITDVAQLCGFSSSQALAKALRREVGVTAKYIRGLRQQEADQEIELLLQRLGHPEQEAEGYMEKTMAKAIDFQICEFPVRYLRQELVSPPDTLTLTKVWQRQAKSPGQELFMVSAVDDFDVPYEQQTVRIGIEVDGQEESNYVLTGGRFLCCRVMVSSEIGYLAAWDALYSHLITLEHEPEEGGDSFEIVHNPERFLSDISEMTLALPLAQKR